MKIKKKTSKGGAGTCWRADFRDVEKLPDTKAVRTGFLINFTAISLFCFLFMIGAYREYVLRIAVAEVSRVEEQVQGSTPNNRQTLFKGGEFNKLRRRAEQILSFRETPLDAVSFLSELPARVPAEMTLLRLEMDQLPESVGAAALAELAITGRIGTDSGPGPSLLLERFIDSILEAEMLSRFSVQSEIAEFKRNNTTGDFDFEVRFVFSKTEEGS